MKTKNKKILSFSIGAGIFFSAYLGLNVYSYHEFNKNPIKYTEFQQLVEENKVQDVTINGYRINIGLQNGEERTTDNSLSPTFRETMYKNNVEVKNSKLGTVTGMLETLILTLIESLVIILVFMLIIKKMTGGEGSSNILSSSFNDIGSEVTNKKYSFKDVAGIDEATESLKEIVSYLNDPNEVINMGIRPPTGVLLEGPPGTGKTLLAKAIAGEAGVPFISVSGSDFIQMFVGVGATRVRNLFAKAKKYGKCVIFIDEIDAIGKKRSNQLTTNSESDQTINALLTEMDGFKDNKGIVVLAATNRADILDSALVRPGRFDRKIVVSAPDVKGREQILKVHAKNKSIEEGIDFESIAKKTVGFTGSDLENLLNESGWDALKHKQKVIKEDNIERAIDKIVAGDIKKRSGMTEENRKLAAYHECGHALVTRLMARKTIEKITIVSTSKALGYVMPTQKDSVLSSKVDMLNEIDICMGGRAAEKIMYGEDKVTSGASQDFNQATSYAQRMVFNYGMSELGPISINQDLLEIVGDSIKNQAFCEVQKILTTELKKVENFLEQHKPLLEKLTNHLLKVETMNSKEIEMFLSEEIKAIEEKEVVR